MKEKSGLDSYNSKESGVLGVDGLDITAFVMMGLLIGIAIGLFVFLGGWPGRVARRLEHPYADAVSVGGWVTLVFGGVGWPFILIWAYAVPADDPIEQPSVTEE